MLTGEIVAAMRLNSDLVALLEGEENIAAYRHNYPTSQALDVAIGEMKPPSLLLAFRAFRSTGRSRQLEHTFVIAAKCKGGIGPLLVALRNGRVGAGEKFYLYPINNDVHPVDIISASTRPEFIGDKLVSEFFEITCTVTERGSDN